MEVANARESARNGKGWQAQQKRQGAEVVAFGMITQAPLRSYTKLFFFGAGAVLKEKKLYHVPANFIVDASSSTLASSSAACEAPVSVPSAPAAAAAAGAAAAAAS